MDLVDGTPILDIKPYLPHFDAYPDATCASWVGEADKTPRAPVSWSDEVLEQLEDDSKAALQLRMPFTDAQSFQKAVTETLGLDIRSRFLKGKHADVNVFNGTLRFCGYIVEYELHQSDEDDKTVRVSGLRVAEVPRFASYQKNENNDPEK